VIVGRRAWWYMDVVVDVVVVLMQVQVFVCPYIRMCVLGGSVIPSSVDMECCHGSLVPPIADNRHTKTKGTEREPEWRIFSLPALV